MARHYSTKSFFRNAPNKLLERYFKDRDLLTDFNFGIIKEGNPELLFKAWLALPDENKKGMEADFQEIYELSCEKGVKTIIDEAREIKPEELKKFTEWLTVKKNHYDKAFATFLDYPSYWHKAALLFHVDSISYWRKRKNLPNKSVSCGEETLKQLANLFPTIFV